MKPRNDVQEAFSHKGCWHSEEEIREIVEWVKDYNPHYCLNCREFSIVDKFKEFICFLCGTAMECQSYDLEERKKFNVEMRRKLLVAL